MPQVCSGLTITRMFCQSLKMFDRVFGTLEPPKRKGRGEHEEATEVAFKPQIRSETRKRLPEAPENPGPNPPAPHVLVRRPRSRREVVRKADPAVIAAKPAGGGHRGPRAAVQVGRVVCGGWKGPPVDGKNGMG